MVSETIPPNPFLSLIGHFAWSVRRGHGSFLTLEFGPPHLRLRNPIPPRAGRSVKISKNMQRRRVYVQGKWHFWIENTHWKITFLDKILTNFSDKIDLSEEILTDLDGQILQSVVRGSEKNSYRFHFDLGATLEVWPDTDVNEDQWAIYEYGEKITIGHRDGTVSVERDSEKIAPGKYYYEYP